MTWPDPQFKPTISYTSLNRYKQCDLSWALHYENNRLTNRRVYFEHKREHMLLPLNCYPGSVFHLVIDKALKQYAKTGAFPNQADYMELAREFQFEFIRHSVEWVQTMNHIPQEGDPRKKWPEHVFAQPLECFYYEGGFPAGYEDKVDINLKRWFRNFSEMQGMLPLMKTDPATWMFPKEVTKKVSAPWFVHNHEMVVYANYDFATLAPGDVCIYDWKTGNSKDAEEKVSDQLLTYGVYAMNMWGYIPDNIHLYAVWFNDASLTSIEVTPSKLDDMFKVWKKRRAEWVQRLYEVNSHKKTLYEAFPMTNDPETCARCCFKTCKGRDRVNPEDWNKVQGDEAFYDYDD